MPTARALRRTKQRETRPAPPADDPAVTVIHQGLAGGADPGEEELPERGDVLP